MGLAGASPPGVCSNQAGLFAELPIFNRESPLNGPLFELLGILAEGSPGGVPAGGVMPEPVAPGDVADAIGPRGIFAEEGSNGVPTAEEGRPECVADKSPSTGGHQQGHRFLGNYERCLLIRAAYPGRVSLGAA